VIRNEIQKKKKHAGCTNNQITILKHHVFQTNLVDFTKLMNRYI